MTSPSNTRPFTVCIEGNIGSGKTTFLNNFKQFNNTTVLQEPVELWRDVEGMNLLVKQPFPKEKLPYLPNYWI